MHIKDSELVLNADGSIYHLTLLPEDIADTILLVGDPGRVDRISKYFDTLEVQKTRREFVTHTGTYKGKKLTVLSTGIGTDNIDIVMNELDALVNIDFKTRQPRSALRRLNLIRLGTSGSLQADIPVYALVGSHYAIGFDNVLHYYKSDAVREKDIERAFKKDLNWPSSYSDPYVVKAHPSLIEMFDDERLLPGFTGTNVGFYGPQGRVLRLDTQIDNLGGLLSDFRFEGLRITNLEMETSAIFGLARLMGHRAYALNCILANRNTGEFAEDPALAVDQMIQFALEKIAL